MKKRNIQSLKTKAKAIVQSIFEKNEDSDSSEGEKDEESLIWKIGITEFNPKLIQSINAFKNNIQIGPAFYLKNSTLTPFSKFSLFIDEEYLKKLAESSDQYIKNKERMAIYKNNWN